MRRILGATLEIRQPLPHRCDELAGETMGTGDDDKKNSNDRQKNILMLGDTEFATQEPSCRNDARPDQGAGRPISATLALGRNVMKLSDTNFPFNITQTAFEPPAALRDAMRRAATRFWDGQDQIVDAMQDYAEGWFERRHAGTEAALKTAQQVIDAATPLEAMRAYQKWALGSFERIIDDGLLCQKHLMSIGGLLAPPLSPLGEKTEMEPAAEESRRRSPSRVAA